MYVIQRKHFKNLEILKHPFRHELNKNTRKNLKECFLTNKAEQFRYGRYPVAYL